MQIRFQSLFGHTPPPMVVPARPQHGASAHALTVPAVMPITGIRAPPGHTMRPALFILLLLIGPATGATPARADANTASPGFKVERLAEGVYAAVRTDPPGLMVDANSLFIVNATDVVVVDAPEASAEMVAALRRI